MIYIPDVLLTIFYACFGIFLMLTANTVIDFFVPGKFSEEIKRGNCAVAWLSAGSFIGIGEILRAVIMSPVVTTADTSLLHGVVASIVYAILGIILFVTAICLLIYGIENIIYLKRLCVVIRQRVSSYLVSL